MHANPGRSRVVAVAGEVRFDPPMGIDVGTRSLGGRAKDMTRTLAAAIAILGLALPAVAQADPPLIQRDVPITNVVSDADVCGDYGIRWDIDIVADIVSYYDAEGNLVRQVFHIKEDNTVTQLDLSGAPVPGTTLREGPDTFTQTVYFNPDGSVDRIVASGLAARVGNELMDVGRVVLVPLGGGRFELAFNAGQHPVREAASGGPIVRGALPAFCGLYD